MRPNYAFKRTVNDKLARVRRLRAAAQRGRYAAVDRVPHSVTFAV